MPVFLSQNAAGHANKSSMEVRRYSVQIQAALMRSTEGLGPLNNELMKKASLHSMFDHLNVKMECKGLKVLNGTNLLLYCTVRAWRSYCKPQGT